MISNLVRIFVNNYYQCFKNNNFVYNPIYHWVELRLKGCGQPGYYEGLVNYTEPGRPSPYWTSLRVSLLPPAARAHCRPFYSSERIPSSKELAKKATTFKSTVPIYVGREEYQSEEG